VRQVLARVTGAPIPLVTCHLSFVNKLTKIKVEKVKLKHDL
jgi:hypothetical protein